MRCPETSVANHQATLCNIPEKEELICTLAEVRNDKQRKFLLVLLVAYIHFVSSLLRTKS
jgi:hypothetical protein